MKEQNEKKKKNFEEPPTWHGGKNGAAIPGINTPGVELPEFNPPVPNRAWTEMKRELEEEDL